MKKLRFLLVMIFFLGTAFMPAKGVIHGIILNEAGKPLKGIGIKLKLGAHTLDYVYTNSKGHFTLENLKEGSYTVMVSGYPKGYESRFFKNVEVNEDMMVKMNLSLRLMQKQIGLVDRNVTGSSAPSNRTMHTNTSTWADEYEDWSDISIKNKK